MQGYFVYDSKKAGAVTVSHLRFGPDPIRSAYLIGASEAHFVACHQQIFIERYDMLEHAVAGGVFLLNTQARRRAAWDTLPREHAERDHRQEALRFYTIDAYAVAQAAGMGRRINTVMQACFFAISGVLPHEQAIARDQARSGEQLRAQERHLIERN